MKNVDDEVRTALAVVEAKCKEWRDANILSLAKRTHGARVDRIFNKGFRTRNRELQEKTIRITLSGRGREGQAVTIARYGGLSSSTALTLRMANAPPGRMRYSPRVGTCV